VRRRVYVDRPNLEPPPGKVWREVRAHESGRAGDEYPRHHLRAETATA
jgi:hypothetical protein